MRVTYIPSTSELVAAAGREAFRGRVDSADPSTSSALHEGRVKTASLRLC